MPRYQSDWTPPTTELLAIMIGMENMRLQSRMDFSRTPSNHLWPLACVLPVIMFDIYNLQIPLPCTTNRSTRYQIHKNGRKAPFLKVSTHSLQLRENFKPFFHCLQLHSIPATEHLLQQLLLKNCEPVFWKMVDHWLRPHNNFETYYSCWLAGNDSTNTLYYTCAGWVVSFSAVLASVSNWHLQFLYKNPKDKLIWPLMFPCLSLHSFMESFILHFPDRSSTHCAQYTGTHLIFG